MSLRILTFTNLIYACLCFSATAAQAAVPSIPFTVTMSKAVTIGSCSGTSCPYLSLNVGGNTRAAYCPSASNTTSLTCTYTATAGDVDLDGISFVDTNLHDNGISISDQSGNPLTNFAFTAPGNISAVKVDSPTLSLDFVYDSDGRYTLNSSIYNDLTSFLSASSGTFTRASSGTYFDNTGLIQTASSGTPRFDYDPNSHTAKGLLIEESRTNSAKYSEQLDNAVWSRGAPITVTANTTETTAPDGTNNAEKISINSTTAVIFAQLNMVMSGTSATYSIYVKQGNGATAGNKFCLRNQTTATNLVCGSLNYSTNVFTYSVGSSGVSVQNIGNGWKRLIISASSGITSGDSMVAYVGYTGSSYTIGDYMYAWGAQVETGNFATSYIPTTSATVTRAADSLTIPTGSWFSSSAGSILGQYDVSGFSTSYRQYLLGAGASSDSGLDRFNIRAWDGVGAQGPQGVIGNGSTVTTHYIAGAYAGAEKASLGYSASNSAMSRNGSSTTTGVGYSGVAISNIYVGELSSSSMALNGHISKLKYYPLRAANAQLQLMTQ